MTNKEKIKNAIAQDINPKNYYNNIIKQIEKGEKMKKQNIWKWSLIPVCLVIFISGFFIINNENKKILTNKPYVDKENNITLNINEIDNNKFGMPRLNADVKIATSNDINFPVPYTNGIVNIPKDLDKTNMYIFYVKENKESKEYNILSNYEIIYSNDNDRSINVKYSKEHKPLRDYYFSEEKSVTTTINGVDLKIYKFESIYFTEFRFNDYNFDIETSNITEQELSTFLLSILK